MEVRTIMATTVKMTMTPTVAADSNCNHTPTLGGCVQLWLAPCVLKHLVYAWVEDIAVLLVHVLQAGTRHAQGLRQLVQVISILNMQLVLRTASHF